MHSRKLHPYSVAALFFPVKSWLITLLNQSGAVSYPSCSQAIVNVSVCCCGLRYFVVVVRLFSFVSTVKQRPGTVLPLCGKTDYCKPCTVTWAYKVCVVTKFGWYAYCSDDIIHVTHTVPHVHVHSEVYFGLYGTLVNEHWLTRKRRNCWIKSLFLFSLHTKSFS